MQGKFLTEDYIKNFYLRYKNLTPIIRSLVEDGIGYDSKTRLKIKPSGTLEDPKKIGPGNATCLINGNEVTLKQIPKKDGRLYFDKGLGVKGMNVIDKLIYIAASPELVKSDDVVKTEFLPSNFYPKDRKPPNANPVGRDPLELEAKAVKRKQKEEALRDLEILAKKHLREMFETIANRSNRNNQPHKDVTCVIVRDNNTKENIWLYTNDNNAIRNHDNILYLNTNSVQFDTAFNINTHFLHSADSKIELTSKDLDKLYEIYQNTIAKNDPVLFYSTHGLDRAPIFAFAFYLLKNFDNIFLKTDDSDKINAEVLKAFQSFRLAHSPEALTNILQIKQAFYIAFSLKVVALEKQIIEDIEAYIHFAGDNSELTPKAAILKNMLTELGKYRSYDEKHGMMKSLLAHEIPELKKSGIPASTFFTDFNKFKNKIGEPRHYSLAKMLYEVLAARASIEEKAFLICQKGDHPVYNSVDGVAEEAVAAATL